MGNMATTRDGEFLLNGWAGLGFAGVERPRWGEAGLALGDI